ncbi:hypothetical protein [Acinetobacter sp. ANC 4558]|uniref:hypothetical protein n=1 Tax=Acinetobacter sp. ANC 4558 TaxID=1977876 RepID=UPI00148A7345|nr:hypothetical protein [Acinetobacter sp. ANC 4558]
MIKLTTSVLDINEIRYILSMDLILPPFRANALRRQMMWLSLGQERRKAVVL